MLVLYTTQEWCWLSKLLTDLLHEIVVGRRETNRRLHAIHIGLPRGKSRSLLLSMLCLSQVHKCDYRAMFLMQKLSSSPTVAWITTRNMSIWTPEKDVVGCRGGVQGSESRTVKQFHYTKWPDEGIPQDPQVLIDFISFVNQHVPEKSSNQRPLLIHCRYCKHCEISQKNRPQNSLVLSVESWHIVASFCTYTIMRYFLFTRFSLDQ